VLRAPGQNDTLLRVRSVVGLLPMIAAEIVPNDLFMRFPEFRARCDWFVQHRPELARIVANWREPNANGDRLLAILRRRRLKGLLARMLDETEFLSPYGIRSVSRFHRDHPYELDLAGQKFRLDYEPGEGETRIYGGNSNWRGPIWFPLNFLLIESLQRYHYYYGDDLKVEFPAGSGKLMNLSDVAQQLSRRLSHLFLRDDKGNRPVFGGSQKFQTDPHFKDHILFYEYFHGDNGAGIGANHQTGWTALVAKLLQQSGE
jgi:hypothetical protein